MARGIFKRKIRWTRIVVFMILLLGAFLSLVPFYWMIRSAFMDMIEIYIMPPLLWSRVQRLRTLQPCF